ncbi:MAG: MBL fold metallo-hydrolase [Clostridium sp.]|jgi:glyoxylase-like metal-dependent hydrolase (beta-lactamase superfamily II)|nr:MBL fold metallo-hydrolase [Clostridium sp.]
MNNNQIKIGRIVLPDMGTNCYFVYRDGQKSCIVVDPGQDGADIAAKLEHAGLSVAAILLTHGHFDHICGVKELKQKSDAPIYALEQEKELLQDANKNLSARYVGAYTLDADVFLQDGEVVEIADMSLRVIALPGHTVGGACFYIEEAAFLLSGDSLFHESIGRTDHPTGNTKQLVDAIQSRLFTLPEETKVYSGHGTQTTIGHEKRNNPFCAL